MKATYMILAIVLVSSAGALDIDRLEEFLKHIREGVPDRIDGELCETKKVQCESPRPEACIMLYKPVTGSDGKQYSNSCFACAEESVEYYEEETCVVSTKKE